jgi:hypothetical protein
MSGASEVYEPGPTVTAVLCDIEGCWAALDEFTPKLIIVAMPIRAIAVSSPTMAAWPGVAKTGAAIGLTNAMVVINFFISFSSLTSAAGG